LDKPGEMLLDAPGFEPLDDDTLVNPSGPAAQTVSLVLPILEQQDRVRTRVVRDRHHARAARARCAT